MPGFVKSRVAKPLTILPPDRLDELRKCAVKETPYGLEFDADSACYRAAFPAPKAAPLRIASDDEIEAMFEAERRLGGCGCAGGYSNVQRPK
jgi:hypothetical protein